MRSKDDILAIKELEGTVEYLHRHYEDVVEERDKALAEVEQLKQALHDARLENSGQAARIEELKKGNEIITAAVCSGNSIEVERAIQERDEARAEVERLKTINQEVLKANYTMGTTRPEPSRLEIAAMAMQGLLLSSEYPKSVIVTDALWCADKLIAAAKEGK
jgi:hypothetical protein